MDEQVCIVTGANSGVGEATASALAGMGWQVVMLCRNQARGEAARQRIQAAHPDAPPPTLMLADLGDLQSIRRFAAAFLARFTRLDVLINNAGAMMQERVETVDGIEQSFAASYLGHYLLTRLLLDRLRESAPSRVINLAGMSYKRGGLELDDWNLAARPYDAQLASRAAQQARVLFTVALSERLAGSGVTANAVHPGAVLTSAQEQLPWYARLLIHTVMRPGFVRPARGAAPVVRLATDPALSEVSGAFFHKTRQEEPVADREQAERLWALSEGLTGPFDRVEHVQPDSD